MSYISHLPRTVYALGDGLLFDDIIVHMLSTNPNLRVIHRVYSNESSFVTDLSSSCPDVIMLNESDRFSRKRIIALLSPVSLRADVRVIAMSLDDNKVHIYDQPADPMNRQVRVLHSLMAVSGWDELFDLIGGKELLEIAGN